MESGVISFAAIAIIILVLSGYRNGWMNTIIVAVAGTMVGVIPVIRDVLLNVVNAITTALTAVGGG